MSTTIPQRDLRNHNAQIIDRVTAGETFIVTRDGVPVADVIPHVPGRRPPRFRSSADAAARTRLTRAEAAAWSADVRAMSEDVDDIVEDGWGRAAARG